MKFKIFPATEREITSLPITEILTDEGIPHIFPEVKSKGYFDIDFRADRLVLVAGKFIGLIPINETVAINVQPKVGISNLVHIISKSREHLDSLHFFERQYKTTSETSPTIFEFFANCLSVELQQIEKEGIYKQYLRRQANLPAPKGKINIGRTVAMNWSRGRYYRVYCDYFEFTRDNNYNRMIKFTLWYCLNHLINIGSKNTQLIRNLSYFYNFFETIPLDKERSFLAPVINDIQDRKIPMLRLYYENICKICRCIIDDIGIMLSEPGEDVKMLSFIIDMETVFEKYLLYLIREQSYRIGPDTKILDGNKEGKRYLFKDSRDYEAKPDIIIMKEGKFKIILDAKYKMKPSEADRYKIISHALSYGVKKAVLILPLSATLQPGIKRIGEVGREYGIEVFEYCIELEQENLEDQEDQFIEEVIRLCA
jgi:5-methylcytosine-specific restriction enzyme subunit McrC